MKYIKESNVKLTVVGSKFCCLESVRNDCKPPYETSTIHMYQTGYHSQNISIDEPWKENFLFIKLNFNKNWF